MPKNFWIDLKEFVNEDSTQTFYFTAVILITLLLSNQINESIFSTLFGANIVGFYGKELTNFRGLK